VLAVVTNHIWNPTETFVRRHAEDLLPGETVVVALAVEKGCHTDLPVFLLEPARGSVLELAQRACRRIGVLKPPTKKTPMNALVQYGLRRFLARHKVALILAEFMDSSLRFLPLAQEMGIPLFVHAHGYDVSLSLREAYWRRRYVAYNNAAGVIVVSESVKRRLIDIGLNPESIHVIPCCVDVPPAPPAHCSREFVRLLAVGRMTGKKAPLLMLEAFRLAQKKCGRLRFDFVGEGSLFAKAGQYVREHNLDDTVVLHGYKKPEEVRRLMADADMFAQHSIVDPLTGDEEGLPVAILEAMASALPVVSTRHAGIPEAVLDAKTGFLVEEGDTHHMAKCLVRLAGDEALRRAMGRAGWQRARDCFTWDQERNSLITLMGLNQK
jgi:glycosyltransferase involved in cell wall biosynthesis